MQAKLEFFPFLLVNRFYGVGVCRRGPKRIWMYRTRCAREEMRGMKCVRMVQITVKLRLLLMRFCNKRMTPAECWRPYQMQRGAFGAEAVRE